MAKEIPAYRHSAGSEARADASYWFIYLKESGTLRFSYGKTVDVCVVGGGAGGSDDGCGGGGGEVKHAYGVSVNGGEDIAITIGAGGAANTAGNPTTAFGVTAAGGTLGAGGAKGEAGADGSYAFGDTTLARYGAEGGGGADGAYDSSGEAGGADGGGTGGAGGRFGTDATAGAANTGAGGGGHGDDDGWTGSEPEYEGGAAAAGGSGVVIIRGTEADFLPVYFNGTHLQAIYLNGEQASGFVFDGQKIF